MLSLGLKFHASWLVSLVVFYKIIYSFDRFVDMHMISSLTKDLKVLIIHHYRLITQ